jgi:hypothetical protein
MAVLALASCADVDDILHPSRGAEAASNGQTCRFHDATGAGVSKVCDYDCSGSPVATTVKASDQCPAVARYP